MVKPLSFKGEVGIKRGGELEKRKHRRKKAKKEKHHEEPAVVFCKGSGLIRSSGLAVHGEGTEFICQIHPGDTIRVEIDGNIHERTVTIVVSDLDLSINVRLPVDTGEFHEFEYKNLLPDLGKKRADEEKLQLRQKEDLKLAFGTYAGDESTFTYRERKSGSNSSGGYQIVTAVLDKDATREDLLVMRAKKKGDRYCN